MKGVSQQFSLLQPPKRKTIQSLLQVGGVQVAADEQLASPSSGSTDSVDVMPSLDTVDSSPALEEEKQDLKEVASADEAIALLASYSQDSIVNLLLEYYQEPKQRENLSSPPASCFREENVVYVPNSGGPKPHFRCHFRCPLSGVEVSSSIPACLFLETNEELSLATEDIFGSSYLVIQGEVYFAKKKAAKKSCALASLLRLAPSHGKKWSNFKLFLASHKSALDKCMISTKPEHAISILPETTGGEKAVLRSRKVPKEYPQWVCLLYDAGVQSVKISFCEHEQVEIDRDEWCLEPTLIFCKIVVQKPVTMTVQGEPASSRDKALLSAISKLPRLGPSCITAEDSKNEWEIKRSLFESKPDYIEFIDVLPSWASAPFSMEDPQTYYLYELRLYSKSGMSWAAERMGLLSTGCSVDESFSRVTRIGVVFPRDILSNVDRARDTDLTFKAAFRPVTRNAPSQGEDVLVELCNRTVLKDGLRDLESVLELNRFLQHWKQYGMGERGSRARSQLSHLQRGSKGRTYLFVPLCNSGDHTAVDWDLIKRSLRGDSSPILRSPYIYEFPIVHRVDLRRVAGLLIFFAMVLLGKERLAAVFCLHFFGVVVVAIPWLGPWYTVSPTDMRNKFLQHRNKKRVFIHPGRKDFRHLSFASALKNSFFIEGNGSPRDPQEISYPRECLIEASSVRKHAQLNPFGASFREAIDCPTYLVPELATFLPLCRDFVYVVDQAKHYMPQIERKIEVRRLGILVLNTLRVPIENGRSFSLETFLSELEDGTSANQYNRLEFFGDAILGFFIVLQATMADELLWFAEDDLKHMMKQSGSNSALVETALSLGLNRNLVGNYRSWSSACGPVDQQSFDIRLRDTVRIPVKRLSDGFESLLAVAWRANYFSAFSLYRKTRGASIFSSGEPCSCSSIPNAFFQKGLLSNLTGIWKRRVDIVEEVLRKQALVLGELEKGTEVLFHCLTENSVPSRTSSNFSDFTSPLVLCALFDDSLADEESIYCRTAGTLERDVADASLLELAYLREILFDVGAYFLPMMISQELFHLYPDASTGDLMLLRSMATNDDVVAYVLARNNLQNALFDQNAKYQFLEEIKDADTKGWKVWHERGGWIIAGGSQEFRRRTQQNLSPRYPGLLGGRIVGHSKKLPSELTEDLVFSFKAIVGALTLTVGVDKAWDYFQPLFLETLLLTADEARQDSRLSTIAQSYQS